jgi:putative holliday junction resolvase
MPEIVQASSRPATPVSRPILLNDRTVLGFDFGARRIGVAVGNSVTRRAQPLAVIADEGETRWRRIAELIGSWQPAQLVVGVARHPDGAPHEMTARCERFARQLAGRFRLPVACVDERYSSVVTRDGRDDEAAAVILQQWFDEAVAPASASAGPQGEGKAAASSPGDVVGDAP